MRPQTNFHNVCAEILPGQPLSCPDPPGTASSVYRSQPLLESGETQVSLVHVLPHQLMTLSTYPSSRDTSLVIVALDAASISPVTPKKRKKRCNRAISFGWTMDPPRSRVSESQ